MLSNSFHRLIVFLSAIGVTKIQGEPLHRRRYIQRVAKVWQISYFISETVRDKGNGYFGSLTGSHR